MELLAGAALLQAWEEGAGLLDGPRTEVLLNAAYGPAKPPWCDQPLGWRDAALLRLYRAGRSGALETITDCPACGTVLEFAPNLTKMLAVYCGERPDLEWFTVNALGGAVEARNPNVTDLAAASAGRDLEEARAILIDRCVRPVPSSAAFGRSRFKSELSSEADEETILTVASALDDRDPLADVSVDIGCVECGHRWSTRLEVLPVVWAQVSARARELIRDIDVLARRYGWSQDQILALGSHRRQTFLELS